MQYLKCFITFTYIEFSLFFSEFWPKNEQLPFNQHTADEWDLGQIRVCPPEDS